MNKVPKTIDNVEVKDKEEKLKRVESELGLESSKIGHKEDGITSESAEVHDGNEFQVLETA